MKKIKAPKFEDLSNDLNLYFYSLNREQKEFFVNYLIETIYKWGSNEHGI